MNNREIIMDNYLNPANKKVVNDSNYIKINNNNESCIDNIDLYILIENNVIKDIKFEGEACSITISSSSLLTKLLVNKTIDEALVFIKEYESMINNQEYNKDALGDANCYCEIHKQPNRKLCALLPYIGLKKHLENKKSNQ